MIQPPTAGPNVGARDAMAPMVEAAITRCLPLKYMNAVVNTNGIIEPPRNPCKARNAIMLWMFQAIAHSRLVKVNPAADAANSQRVLITRESQPDMGITMISAIR